MKKSKLKDIIAGLDSLARMNERHMQIQDGAILRKDEEILLAMTIANEFKVKYQETQIALDRSRDFVKMIQSNKIRSIKDMAKDMYELWFERIPEELRIDWKDLAEDQQEYWMGRMIEILSGEKLGRG